MQNCAILAHGGMIMINSNAPTCTAKCVEAPEWDKIEVLQLQETGWLEPTGISASARICHDSENIYVRLEATEENIRAQLTDPLSQVCEDSCVEFFLAPDINDTRYINFEWNPLGTLYLGFGGGRATRMRLIVKKPNELFAPSPFHTENGWGIEFKVPAAFIRSFFPDFKLNGKCACNFYKCGDCTVAPHYLAWSRPLTEKPDFHRREFFGTLVFE